ncbi:hypothetical protein HG537_0E00950 [Torulaspora globosa]|uniref:Uncharacterized protein n=1 Tax=Torulaspora globosa TaxID=48254 RepID=A0A7H9HWI8_9SACH|nr:hypothetical protein HG537_0E00950 [Torulaspora sp. CBS 2947]
MSGKESTDPRFAKIYSDPKFKNVRKKGFKVKLDDRFSKKDLEIKRKTKVDRYGRKMRDQEDDKELKDFDKYFEKSDEEVEKVSTVDRARGEVPSDYVSSSDDFTSSESEVSSEEEVESEEESEVELEKVEPSSGEPSRKLAVVNLDWDNVRSADLMITFSSFLPADGKITEIAIYPSEFGKERMQREEVEGPPKELFQKKNKKSKRREDDDSDSDVDIKDLYEEGDADKNVDNKALRQYQLDRLRYYYAIVSCNSVKAAESIYKNCDGTEYESTANIFDLRYVPDGMEFDETPRDVCTELPKNYKPLQFSTDALQHSNVKLTWDETPADRLDVAKRAFTQKEIEDMDFKAYLASDSEGSEDELGVESKDKLRSLVNGTSAFNFSKQDAENDVDDDSEVDMEITFTPGLDEKTDNAPKEDQEESTIDKIRRKEKERRKARKAKVKELKQQAESEKKAKLKSLKQKKDQNEDQDSKSKAELELLMMEDEDNHSSLNKKAHFNMNEILKSEKEKKKKNKYQDRKKIVEDNFKPNLQDSRFKEVFEGHDFAIDPSQPEYRDTKAMKEILAERSKRSRKNKSKKRRPSIQANDANEKSDIAGIVAKLKRTGTKRIKSK